MEPRDKIKRWGRWVNAGYSGEDLVPLPAGEKGPRIAGWESRVFSRDDLRTSAKQGLELGLRTRRFPALDVDCDDRLVTDTVRRVLREGSGPAPMIRSRTPAGVERFAAIFRLEEGAEGFPKQFRQFESHDPLTGAVSTFKLEMLADGQQLKVMGAHDTPDGGEYEIEGGEIPSPGELPPLDADRADALLDRIEHELEHASGGLIRRAKKGGGGARRAGSGSGELPDWAKASPHVVPQTPLDEEELRERAQRFPVNTSANFPTHNDVVAFGGAIFGACGGADFGLEVFQKWQMDPAGDYSDEEPSYTKGIWDSFHRGGARSGLKELDNKYIARASQAQACAVARSVYKRHADRGAGIEEARSAQGIEIEEANEQEHRKRAAAKQALRDAVEGAPTPHEVSADDPFAVCTRWPVSGAIPSVWAYKSLSDAALAMVFRTEDATLYDRATGSTLGGRGWANAAQVLKVTFGNAPELNYEVEVKSGGGGGGQKGGGQKGQKDADQKDADPNGSQKGQKQGAQQPETKTKKMPLAEWLSGCADIPRAQTVGYFPGGPEFYRDGDSGSTVWNRWRATPEVRQAMLDWTAGAAGVWPDLEDTDFGKLQRAFYEATGEPDREAHWSLFLDWCAVMVCAPAVKPGHHYLYAGGQGIGKSLTAEVLAQMIGQSNVTHVTAQSLASEFAEFAKGRLILVDELYTVTGNSGAQGQSTYNSMKTYMARTPDVLTVNIKYGRPEKVMNRGGWLMATNADPGTMRLDTDDRRVAVVDCARLSGAERQAAADACRALGAEKDAGWSRQWRTATARAFVARMAAVWADPARWAAVMGPPPATETKAQMALDAGSPVADWIMQARDDGLLPDVTTIGEIQRVCRVRRGVPTNVANALGNGRVVREELEAAGAAVGARRCRMPDGGAQVAGERHPKGVPVALPAAGTGHPRAQEGAEGVAASDMLARVREWREEWMAKTRENWAKAREDALARHNE